MSSPRMTIWPPEGLKSPAIRLKSVVFPAPFGPRIARRSPPTTSRSTSRTACTPPKRLPTPRSERTVLAGSGCVEATLTRVSIGGGRAPPLGAMAPARLLIGSLLDELVRDLAALDDLDLA